MIQQKIFSLTPKKRGCHLITSEILKNLPAPLPQAGLLNLFVQHTSCALSINENADPDVRSDMAAIMDHMVKENEPYYDHIFEGADDMPAHARSSESALRYRFPTGDWLSEPGKESTFASSETMGERGRL